MMTFATFFACTYSTRFDALKNLSQMIVISDEKDCKLYPMDRQRHVFSFKFLGSSTH